MTPNYHKYTSDIPIYSWHTRRFQDRLIRLVRASGARSVFEAGCGEGFLISRLKEALPEVQFTGLDLSPSRIEHAREHFGDRAHFHTGTIYEIPAESGSADLVLCSQVLEHLEEPEAAMEELARVARHHLLVSVPREPVFRLLNGVAMLLRLGPPPGHVQFWNHRQFRRFVRGWIAGPAFEVQLAHQLAYGPVLRADLRARAQGEGARALPDAVREAG